MQKNSIMVRKSLILFVCFVLLSLFICACQSEEKQNDESGKYLTNTSDTTDSASISQWKKAYLDFLKTKKDTHRYYALVYIDNDDIPELYLSGDGEATGDSICAYKNGTVVEQPLHRIGGGWYIEKSGNIINKNGHMGQHHTHVYKLNDVGFALTFEALSSERIETLENGECRLYFEYSIGDKVVNEAEYNTAVDAVDVDLDFENAVQLNENEVEYDLIVQQIIDHH